MHFPFLHLCFRETEASSCNLRCQLTVLQVESVATDSTNVKQQSDSSLFGVAERFRIQLKWMRFYRKRTRVTQARTGPSVPLCGPQVSLVSRARTHLKMLSKVSGIQPRCFLRVVPSSYSAAFSHLSVLFIAGLPERLNGVSPRNR